MRVYRAGWLTVRRTYEPVPSSAQNYASQLVTGYRNFMDARSKDAAARKPKPQPSRERFYCVLKQRTLFLYDNQDQVDCWAAVDLSAHKVVIYPEDGADGELFVKRNAITLVASSGEGQSPLAAHRPNEDLTHDLSSTKLLPWFIFTQVNSDKEDWLHSLVEASKLGQGEATAAERAKDEAMFEADDMARLIDGIDSQPDSIPTRWLNAILGRIFLSVYRTHALEAHITSRIVRKLKRVKTPAILSEIKVREVNVGTAAPIFSKPMLKELTPEGDASMEIHVSYVGEMRVTIETVATVSLPRLKPYSVRLVLAVILKEIEGTMLFKIKRPPSNRLWFGFQQMPRMVLEVVPVVSARKINWSLVTSPIESRIREVVLESLVVPHMDDLAFFDTRPYANRGGIWGDALRKEFNLDEETAEPAPEAAPASQEGAVDNEKGAGDEGVPLATTVEAEESSARQRPRRRRSSEGDSGQLGFSDANPNLPSMAGDRSVSGTSSGRTTLSSSAVSMYSAWKEGRTAKPKEAETDKKKNWFGPSRTASTASGQSTSASATPAPASGSASPARPRATSMQGESNDGPQGDQASASRLRDLLAERARSREREKNERLERAVAAAGVEQASDLAELADWSKKQTKVEQFAQLPVPSALSLTAPTAEPSALKETASAVSVETEVMAPAVAEELSSTASSTRGLTESPAMSLSRFPTDDSASLAPPEAVASSYSSTESAAPPVPPRAHSPPPLPSRPAAPGDKPVTDSASTPPPPPPPRRASHAPSASVDAAGAGNKTSALLGAWRTKAGDIDKEAVAAGVAQARESLKRWGANWGNKKVQGEQDDESPVIDGGRVLPSSSGGTAGKADAYREHRSARSQGAYFAAESPTRTAPVTMGANGERSAGPSHSRRSSMTLGSSPTKGGHAFTPPKTGAGTMLSEVKGAGSPGGKGGKAVYKPATRMAIPGIRDEVLRRAVAEDHVEAEEEAKATEGDKAKAGEGEGLLARPAWLQSKPSTGSVASAAATSVTVALTPVEAGPMVNEASEAMPASAGQDVDQDAWGLGDDAGGEGGKDDGKVVETGGPL